MTSSVSAVKRKSDGIYGIFGVTVLRLLPELNRRALGTRCMVCVLVVFVVRVDGICCLLQSTDLSRTE